MIRRIGIVLISFLFAQSLLAASYEKHEVKGNALRISTPWSGIIQIKALTPSAFEVLYGADNSDQMESFAVSSDELANQSPFQIKVSAKKDFIEIQTSELTARVQKNPIRVQYFKDGKLLGQDQGDMNNGVTRGFKFKLNKSEKLMGTGMRVLGMDRRGHRLPLYNRPHYGYETRSEQMYYGLPAVMSDNKYIIVYDNSAAGFVDLGKTEKDILQFESVGGRSSYLFIAGDTYPQLINNYVDVTGKQPLPPRWAFGNYASRFGYHSEKEAREVIAKFKQEEIPLDAIVFDIYWFGKEMKGTMGNLEWYEPAFPKPEKMMKDFADQGVKTILITEPFILSTSKKWEDAVDEEVLALDTRGNPKRFDFYFGNTGLVDVFKLEAQEWYWDIYKELKEQGVAGWWGDLGEPEVHPANTIHVNGTGHEVHNAYGHTWAKMVYENQLKDFPDERPFVLMRSGFAGSQRYGMIPWTGDVNRTWGGFKPQVELSLQMGLLGIGYQHSDLGGFAGGEAFNKELYIRWLQYGVFQPVYRPHAQEHIAPEPIFHDQETKDIVRDYINLRYQMVPYIYTMAYQNSTTGMPLMRPVFFENEKDKKLIAEKDTYLWGDELLVTPVTEAGVKSVSVNAPKGNWYDFWSGKLYKGGKKINVPVTMETMPVLVREGAFIPMADKMSSLDKYNPLNITLHHWLGKHGVAETGQLFEDDGQSPNTLVEENYELIEFSSLASTKGFEISIKPSKATRSNYRDKRVFNLVVNQVGKKVKSVMVSGKPVKFTQNGKVLTFEMSPSVSGETAIVSY